jgi:hypothetical protein
MKLYSGAGERLYLTSQERNRVEQELRLQTRDTMTFTLTLLYTGCRITKAPLPKGLRHGFGVYAVAECEIPLNMVQKWMGHKELKTTAIYANAVGKEGALLTVCGNDLRVISLYHTTNMPSQSIHAGFELI